MEGPVEYGLLGVGSEVAVGVQGEGAFQSLTLDGEGGGVEDLEIAGAELGIWRKIS